MQSFLVLAVFSGGCLQIEAEIEESCITRKDVQIEGVDSTVVSRELIVDDLSDVKRLLEYNAELDFARVEVRPTSGVTRLDFVELAFVAVEGSPVYGCNGDCPSADGSIALPAAVTTSATQYFAADSLAIQLTVTGALPKAAWTVDLDVCVRGTASYTLAP
jgi:hypothetical protein